MGQKLLVEIDSQEFKDAVAKEVARLMDGNVKEDSPNDLLSPEEVCNMLNIKSKNPNRVLYYYKKPQNFKYPLKPARGLSRKHQFRRKDVEEFMKNNF